MKTAYIFDHKDYFHALQPQIGGGFAVYAGTRQRGGGLGGVLGALVKYGIPIAKKYILPHAKDAFLRTVADITSDRSSAKESVKNNSKRLIKDIGSSIVSKLVQDGSGLNVLISNQPVTDGNTCYGYKAIMESLLSYGPDYNDTQGTAALFFKDDSLSQDETNNSGFSSRKDYVKKSKVTI
ncbi:hypothetical protein Fcan01_11171 [Folsomia candida]|uniref:Uncharacterized protein n=1 Tax=Folsomia candida TaxID=158441 RepID=A0A226EAR2_FOLCA|nr:hypothetical protein Fcan01_11171 [Folsomia candida]